MLLDNISADGLDDGSCWWCIKILPCCLNAGILRTRTWQMSPSVSYVAPSQQVWRKCSWVMTHLSSSIYFSPPWHSNDLEAKSKKKWRRQAEVKTYGLSFTLRVNDITMKDKQGTSWSSYRSWHNWAAPWTPMLWACTWKVPPDAPDAVLQSCWQSEQIMPSSPPHQRGCSYQSLVNEKQPSCSCQTKINCHKSICIWV